MLFEMQALKKIWMDGMLVNWEDAKIHVLTHALHYGYAIFEGIRCNWTERGPAVFRLEEHMDRFVNGAKIYRMKLGYSKDELSRACTDVVRTNGVKECYIRPIAYTGYGEMGLNPLKNPVSVAVAAWEWGPYLGEEGVTKGVRCTVSSWVRNDPRSLPPQAKCSANYANSALAKMEAIAAGYDEAIMLNGEGMVAEGPGENIFRVKGGNMATPPESSAILRGITRDSILKISSDMDISVHQSDFTREELFTSDELFFTGTAAGVTPIREVDGRNVGNGDYPTVRKLQKAYEDAIHGRAKKYESWLTYVTA